MVLIIDGYKISAPVTASELQHQYQLLKTNSKTVLSRPVKQVNASEKCLYVGQREMAVVENRDNLNMVGREDASTCHIVILRDVQLNSIIVCTWKHTSNTHFP
jgi:hypothetical protein